MRVLLVEDDLDLLNSTAYALRRERFEVIEARDGVQALHRWKVERPDLIVLDIGLPRQDGFHLLQRVRETSATPVIVVTGRTDEQNIVRAFNLGADDLVAKPIVAKLLALKIRALLRRAAPVAVEASAPPVVLGDLRIDPELQEVNWGGRYLRLTPTEFRTFHLLAANAGRTVTTSRLLAYVWGDQAGDLNALRTHISHIRAKLNLRDARIGAAIVGVLGVGYRFDPGSPAEKDAADPRPAEAPTTN